MHVHADAVAYVRVDGDQETPYCTWAVEAATEGCCACVDLNWAWEMGLGIGCNWK